METTKQTKRKQIDEKEIYWHHCPKITTIGPFGTAFPTFIGYNINDCPACNGNATLIKEPTGDQSLQYNQL